MGGSANISTMRDRKAQAKALRNLASYLEEDETELPDELEAAVDNIVDLLAFHARVEEAARDWHEREARGERAIPSAEARRILGL